MFPDTKREEGAAGVVPEGDVAEISLLVPGWQAEALERAARSNGLTTGQLLRRLIADSLRWAHVQVGGG